MSNSGPLNALFFAKIARDSPELFAELRRGSAYPKLDQGVFRQLDLLPQRAHQPERFRSNGLPKKIANLLNYSRKYCVQAVVLNKSFDGLEFLY